MRADAAYAALRKLGAPAIQTSDAAAALGKSTPSAAKTLARLAETGLVINVRHGLWWLDGPIEPHRLVPYLAAPLESYVSLQTALYLHGLIDQIPAITYAATLARTQRVETSAGTYSLHHLAPEVFGGYETSERGAKIATAEKALFDFAYLSAGRSRLFTSLPEIELPHGFRRAELKRWLAKIPSERSRTITQRKLDELLRQV